MQANKEATDVLAVGYGTAKRFQFFYSELKHSSHFLLPNRSQKEQQGEVASSQSPHAFAWHRPSLSGTTLRWIQTWIFKSQFKYLFRNSCLQLGIFVLYWWQLLYWVYQNQELDQHVSYTSGNADKSTGKSTLFSPLPYARVKSSCTSTEKQ